MNLISRFSSQSLLRQLHFTRSRYILYSFPKRLISDKTIETIWDDLSEKDKQNYAICYDYPKHVELAYYKGKAMKELGIEYAGEAIASFEDAIQMDAKYRERCESEIKKIYMDLEKSHRMPSSNKKN